MRRIFLFFLIIASHQISAQLIKDKSIDASIGYGLNSPNDGFDINGSGFYIQGEYVLSIAKWIDIRPYAGLIFVKTNSDDNKENEPGYKVTTNAFLIGGKTRIKAPIPWVAPYIEIGIGASLGSFETFTPNTDIEDSGIVMHIPWSIGLELGRNHNFDISFNYYENPSLEQFSGGFAFGYSFPLDN